MDEKNDLIKVGKYDLRYNELLSIDIEELDIFRSKGLPAHICLIIRNYWRKCNEKMVGETTERRSCRNDYEK